MSAASRPAHLIRLSDLSRAQLDDVLVLSMRLKKRGKGAGELASDLSSKPISCTACRGSGKCLKCKGEGTLSFQCIPCKGRGKIVDYDRVRSELKQVAERLHEQCADAKKAP